MSSANGLVGAVGYRPAVTDDDSSLDRIAEPRFGSIDAIRTALLPEDVAEFEAALAANPESAMLVWRRIALMTERDTAAQRSLNDVVAEIRRTRRPRAGSLSRAELRAELGL